MKKKVIFGITGLTLGGAERVLVDLANRLVEDEYEVTIFTIYDKGEFKTELREEVIVKSLCKEAYAELSTFQKKIGMPLKVLLRKKKIYREYVRGNYDAEIAFLEGPITRIFSVKNKETKKIAWIHNDVSLVFGKGMKSFLKRWMDKKVYEKYQTLVFVSRDNRDKFEKVYPEIRDSLLRTIPKRVIYNYINPKTVLQKAEEQQTEIQKEDKTPTFLIVARLVAQKGIDRMLEVHRRLLEKGYQNRFYVIGEGPLHEELKEKIQKANVKETFTLLGKKENPYPYMKDADYFCLPSYFEGYGMVLEEAKILKKPIIITDTAAREAVEKYPNSKIVENTEEGIYQGLVEICKQYQKGNKKFSETEAEDYDNTKIITKIKNVIEEKREE